MILPALANGIPTRHEAVYGHERRVRKEPLIESIRSRPELLAPAGGPEALRAAVANGADAVYLGVESLNARRGAVNFSLAELGEHVRFAHLHDVRVYLTANVLVLESEMQQALTLIDEAWASGVDAVIVQDLGLLSVVRRHLPEVRLHASTQLNAHNVSTVDLLAELGASRVTLSRELSLAEISTIVEHAHVEVESFVHGALCVCYSGQCLLSSMIGGRSANRGRCAQPCRLTYELVDASHGVREAPGRHLLSPRDLAAIAVLPELVGTGVAALKIEGRMKSPEYVALVTGVYRAALDRALAAPDAFEVRDAELDVLAEAFSRGFSEAYLVDERGNDMMSYARPNNRGVLVGRVADVSAGKATVTLESALDADDTIEVWTATGRFAQRAGALVVDGVEHAVAPAGARAVVRLDEPVRPGDRVFRVANASLLAAARRTFEGGSQRPVAVDFRVNAVVGEPFAITVSDSRGRRGTASGSVVEPARTKPLTADEIVEHVGRLGGTPYQSREWDIALSPDAGAGFSLLHRVRRQALSDYEEGLLAPWAGRAPVHPRVDAQGRGRVDTARRAAGTPAAVQLVADCRDGESARSALDAGADLAYVPADEFRVDPGPAAAGDRERLAPVVPRILHDREVERALQVVAHASRVAVGNLGALALLRDAGTGLDAHWSLNAANPWAARALCGLGARLVWLSPELSERQVRSIARSAGIPVGTSVYGRQELMVTEHCVLMAEGECSRECDQCARRRQKRSLRDRKGYEFPVWTDASGRTHLFNSLPLDLTGSLDEVLETGVAAVRVDLSGEDVTRSGEIVRAVRRAIDTAVAGRAQAKIAQHSTTGHFFRGID